MITELVAQLWDRIPEFTTNSGKNCGQIYEIVQLLCFKQEV